MRVYRINYNDNNYKSSWVCLQINKKLIFRNNLFFLTRLMNEHQPWTKNLLDYFSSQEKHVFCRMHARSSERCRCKQLLRSVETSFGSACANVRGPRTERADPVFLQHFEVMSSTKRDNVFPLHRNITDTLKMSYCLPSGTRNKKLVFFLQRQMKN